MHHFATERCTGAHFCYKMVYCGMWDWCIMGFAQQLYSHWWIFSHWSLGDVAIIVNVWFSNLFYCFISVAHSMESTPAVMQHDHNDDKSTLVMWRLMSCIKLNKINYKFPAIAYSTSWFARFFQWEWYHECARQHVLRGAAVIWPDADTRAEAGRQGHQCHWGEQKGIC